MLEFVLEEFSKLSSSSHAIKNATFGVAGPTKPQRRSSNKYRKLGNKCHHSEFDIKRPWAQ
jgi:hypothetical protein